MRVAYKIWIENEGKAFGEGPYRLLKGVEKTGSLHQASMEMGMSYRKAWITLNACEKRLGLQLIERKVGGASGGGSQITAQGKEFIRKYEQFREDVINAVEKAYNRYFH